MKKRVLALILTFSMVFTMLNTAFAASPSEFSDLPDDWSRGAVERAIENGLLSGSHGKINASAQLTRAELAAIIVRAFGAEQTADLSGFTDVSPTEWYYDAMQKAVAMGILNGAHGKLNPNAPITREEVCAVLHRAFLLDGGSAALGFGDAGQISDWAQSAVSAMAANGYIAGDAYGNVNADKTITRAEFAQMMDNLVKAYPTGDSGSGGVIEGNAIMRAGDNLSGVTIKGDLILADGLGLGDVDLSDCTVEGRILVRGSSEVKLSGMTYAGGGVVAAASAKLTNSTGRKLTSVFVTGNNASVTLSGLIGRVEIKADNVTIHAAADAEIDTVETAANRTTIKGDGDVAAVNVRTGALGTEVTTGKTDITVESGAGSVESTNGSLSAGETGTTDNSGALQSGNKTSDSSKDSSTGSSGGNTSSVGGSSSGSSHRPSPVTRYDVTDETGRSIGSFKKGTVLTIDPANGDDRYTVTVNGTTRLETPDYEGYAFNGWLVSGSVITAQWTEAVSQTVEVKDDSGETIGSFQSGDVLTIDYDNGTEPFDVTVAENTVIALPEKEGYTFDGWDVDGMTITAKWEREAARTVEVKDSDGNLIGAFEIDTILTIDYDDDKTEPFEVTVSGNVEIEVPEREGYTFDGWDVDGMTITAVWEREAARTVEVKDSDGNLIGTFEIDTVLTIDYDDDKTEPFEVTVSEDLEIEVPEKEGYTFIGWDTNDENVTAQWQDNEEPTETIEVTDSEGNSIGTYEIGTLLTVDRGDDSAPYTVIVNTNTVIQVPERTGYTFTGWDVDEYDNTQITAKWTQNETKQVTVRDETDDEIGTFDVGTVLTIIIEEGSAGQTVTVVENMAPISIPEKDGFTFKEWKVEGTTITAVWEEIPAGEITVKDGENRTIGTFAAGTELTIETGDGSADQTYTVTVAENTVIEVPTRDGYIFIGWTVDGTTVTAKWDKNITEDEEGAPVDLMVAYATEMDDSITLVWDKPEEYADVTAYYIYCNGEKIGESGPKKTHFTAYNLESGTEYAFRVSAVRDSGEASTKDLSASTAPESTVINVMDAPYNAAGDGSTMDTAAIQMAIDNCPEGGTVLLPEGYTFLSGALDLKSDMTFRVDGALKGSTEADDYLTAEGRLIMSRFEGWELECYRALVNAGHINQNNRAEVTCRNVKIIGKGTIQGGGTTLMNDMQDTCAKGTVYEGFTYSDIYNNGNHKGARIRGRLINLSQCENVNIAGVEGFKLNIKDPPTWTIHPIYCNNVTTHNVSVYTVGMRNGDGWDPDSSSNCMLFDAVMATGDDSVAIKSGKNPDGNDVDIPARNIRVFDMLSSPGLRSLGVAIGSEMSGGVENVSIRDITLSDDTRYGIEFKASAGRGGYIRNVKVQDSDINALLIHSVSYNSDGAGRGLPVFSDMEFRNLNISGARDSKAQTPIELKGFSEGCDASPVRNLAFENITIGTETYTSKTIWMENCDGLTFRNVKMYDGSEPTYNNRVHSTTNAVVYGDADTTLHVETGGKIISGATDTVAMTVENGVTVGELRAAIRDTGEKQYVFHAASGDTTPLADTVTFDQNGTRYLTVTAPDGTTTKRYSITVRDPILTVTVDATKNGVTGGSGSSDGKYFNVDDVVVGDAVTLSDSVNISAGRCFRAAYSARTASTCGIFDLYLVSEGGAEVKIGTADMQTGKFTQEEQYGKVGVGVPAGAYTVKFVCITAGKFSLGTLKLVGDANYTGGFVVNLDPLSDLTFVKNDPVQTVAVNASTANNAEITYEVNSSDTDVATVSLNDTSLTVAPGDVGTATITVTAKAAGYDDAVRTFTVTVTATSGPIEIDVVKLACGRAYGDISSGETVALEGSENITLTGIKDTISSFNVTCNKSGNITSSYFQVSGKSASEVPIGSVVQLETPVTLTREMAYTATLYTKTGNNRGAFKVQLVPVSEDGTADETAIIDLGKVNLYKATGGTFEEVDVVPDNSPVTISAGRYKLRFTCVDRAGFLIVRNLTLTPATETTTP